MKPAAVWLGAGLERKRREWKIIKESGKSYVDDIIDIITIAVMDKGMYNRLVGRATTKNQQLVTSVGHVGPACGSVSKP